MDLYSYLYAWLMDSLCIFNCRILVVSLQEKIAAFDSCTFTKKFFVTSKQTVLKVTGLFSLWIYTNSSEGPPVLFNSPHTMTSLKSTRLVFLSCEPAQSHLHACNRSILPCHSAQLYDIKDRSQAPFSTGR